MSNMLVGASTMPDEMNETRPIHLSYKGENLLHTLDAVGAAMNTAQPIILPTPAKPVIPGVRIERLTGRPDWRTTAGVGMGAGVLGFVVGLLIGKSNGRSSRASRRSRASRK